MKRDERYNAVSGTKGYFWKESYMVREMGQEDEIDMTYYEELADKAIETISQYGDFDEFVK